jgi:zinc/manganese transport system permease protein
VVHYILRSHSCSSFRRDRAYEEGLRVRWWDFLFYALFGLVVTIFVRVAGVLLVFSYLIVPAVCAITLARKTSARLLIGWVVSLIGGIAGLYLSFYGDFPSGAAIVCTFGALLILVSFLSLLRRRPQVLQS